jgi:hypothetical protein
MSANLFLKTNGKPFRLIQLHLFSKIVGFKVTPVQIRHLWCTFAGNSKELANTESATAGHSKSTFEKVYNESGISASQRLIQAISKKTGADRKSGERASLSHNDDKGVRNMTKKIRHWRIFGENDDSKVSKNNPLATGQRFSFIHSALGLDPDWLKKTKTLRKEQFMLHTLLLSLQSGRKFLTRLRRVELCNCIFSTFPYSL